MILNGAPLPDLDADGDPGARGDAREDTRLPGNLNVSFAGVEGEALLVA